MANDDKEDFSIWDLEGDDVDDIIDDEEDPVEIPSRKSPGKAKASPSKKGLKAPGDRSRSIPPPARVRPSAGRSEAGGKNGKEVKGNPFLKSKPFVWTMRLFIVIVVLLLLFLPVASLERMREDSGLYQLRNLLRPYREFPEWVEASLSVQYDLSISSGVLDMARIKTAIPFDIMDEEDGFRIQNVTSVDMVPDPTFPVQNYNTQKNTVSGWEIRNEGFKDLQFVAEFDVVLYTYRWEIDPEDTGSVNDIPDDLKARYLDDEWEVREDNGDIIDNDGDGVPDLFRYHPSHPKIRSVAEMVTEGETTVLGKVKAIYDWMQERFNYTNNEQRQRDSQLYGSWPKYPLGTLADWYGDCDDQSLLMASLCRSIGIPAWLEIGYLYDPSLGSWGGHGWFNVAIPVRTGAGIQNVVAPIDPVNHEFLFRDPYRITDWIDTGGDLTDLDGDVVFNLDYYYNYFKVSKNRFVNVDIDLTTTSLAFEGNGRIKEYMDHKLEAGNLPGTEGGMPEMPFPFALSLVLMAVPALLPSTVGRKRIE